MAIFKRLNAECGLFKNKFTVLYDYTENDKLAIDGKDKLIIQPASPFRFFVRKITGQNFLTLDAYLRREILSNYCSHLTEILTLPAEKKQDENYIIIVNANNNTIHQMCSAFRLLKKHYSNVRNSSQIGQTLDKIISLTDLFKEKFENILNQHQE